MSKTGFLKVSFLIFCLFVALSPIRVSTQKGITQTLSLDPQNPVHRARIEQAKSETVAVNQVRQLLTSAQVPFDPLVLFSRNWRQKLAPVLARMPEMYMESFHRGPLSGVKLADTLHLPEKVKLDGDTVIIANRIKFEGRNILIKGNHGIHIFITGKPDLTGLGRRAIELAGGPGSITIDTSGPGRQEWLEQKRKSIAAQATPEREVASLRTRRSASRIYLNHRSGTLRPQSNDGTAGCNGDPGVSGSNGGNGAGGFNGAAGSCFGGVNGGDGGPGESGVGGVDGVSGAAACNGGNGGPVTLNITDPNDSTPYHLSAKGGPGGNGGAGGYGGRGGDGGNGGTGGDGASCNCNPGGLGNGGSGGDGGGAGTGGSAGNGGTGGNGGNGGTITVTYPAGYNTGNVSTDASGGAGGQGGDAGFPGQPGTVGKGGKAGSPGSQIGCSAGTGHDGQTGTNGSVGTTGSPGDPGTPGTAGSVSFSQTGGGGGPGGGDLEPGSYDGYCTEWWWVEYSCTEELGENQPRDSRLRAYANHASLRRHVAVEWDCVETGRWYAGCW